MPDPCIRLSILKLDNTFFEVKIAANATVSDLKTAIENIFRDNTDEDSGLISWSHVWGHFCLSFQDYKFVDDRAILKDFGVKDGDQLQFTRKLSVRLCPDKQIKKDQGENLVHNALKSQGPEETEECSKEDENYVKSRQSRSLDNITCDNQDQSNSDNATVGKSKFKLTRKLRSMLSYSKLNAPDVSEKAGKYF